MYDEDQHRVYRRKMDELRFAQATAEGSLRGHVTFMLNCHEFGTVDERQWKKLKHYRDEAERAGAALANHVFSTPEF